MREAYNMNVPRRTEREAIEYGKKHLTENNHDPDNWSFEIVNSSGIRGYSIILKRKQ